jgi:hypothetical protein
MNDIAYGLAMFIMGAWCGVLLMALLFMARRDRDRDE